MIIVFHSCLIAGNANIFNRNPQLNADTLLSDPTGITNHNGGILNNQGTIMLSGNLNSQSADLTNLGSGTISMSDTVPQIISGQNILGNLILTILQGLILKAIPF